MKINQFKTKRIMKLLLIILILTSCNYQEDNKIKVITNKSYFYWGSQELLPKGLCRFTINNNHEFMDSCNFYYISDTIGKLKNRFK